MPLHGLRIIRFFGLQSIADELMAFAAAMQIILPSSTKSYGKKTDLSTMSVSCRNIRDWFYDVFCTALLNRFLWHVLTRPGMAAAS